MHQVRFVEDIAVEFAPFGILDENLRGLRETGQQLVRRLRRKDHRILAARAISADGMVIAVEIMESRVRQPGFVEVQGIDHAIEHFLDFFDIVEDAVVGALGDGEYARFGGDRAREGMRRDLLLDVLPAELFFRYRSDDPVVVAGRHQEDRDGTGHDDRMKNRFVAVAIDDDDVAWRDGRMPDDLVRGRGAVGDEKQVVGIEDSRRIALRGGDRTGVVE
ncbi:MAG: hypothetical protein AW09_003190 [Candidatus Accumulibacter phosphatis]|uniref:Uncharacterized protein n=1 Tax=Candidatus Accumulibacter phosphatis TaxID=327160 RepID=A0A080LT89_9PROT|nr:MAG: hypothetical protein AW09_003190 [Candidatus Accumulibacter phosphatis]